MPVHIGQWWIFPLQGVSGERVAFNFARNVAIRSDGADKFIIYAAGQALPVTDADTLDALVAAL